MEAPIYRFTCRTNLDDYQREEWPGFSYIEPKVGYRITAKSGKQLSIVEITIYSDGKLELELHHRRSIPTDRK